ncbi:MAG: nucleoside:proton symporter [Spirulina sp. SIO3F2]|nr:nucleoside:proton symporter [Spirulina sp. SIO3F2]
MNLGLNLISLLGIGGLCVVAWLGSENRRIIPWNVIVFGIGLQLLVGFIVFGLGSGVVEGINSLLNPILDASEAGGRFLFGGSKSLLANDWVIGAGPGAAGRWLARAVGSGYVQVPGDRIGPDSLNPGFSYVLAFRALPQIIFFAGLVSLLYRIQIGGFSILGLDIPKFNPMNAIVRVFAIVFQKTMKISGAESLSGAANIFVGIESAIAIKPFLPKMTRSEICAILTSCFGSIASSVLGLYAGFLRPSFPSIAGHLVSASILTIPACFVVAKILVPETEEPETMGSLPEDVEDEDGKPKPSYMDSLIVGALDGVKMAVGIAAVLIAILGVIALFNAPFNALSNLVGGGDSLIVQFLQNPLRNLMGMLFVPLTALTGVATDWPTLWNASLLIGQRLFETSIPPYLALNGLASSGVLNQRALLIVSYVLCGFAHLPSYGIFVGGVASLVPERRGEISALGFKSLWAATLATLMTGCVAGLFYGLLGDPTSVIGG